TEPPRPLKISLKTKEHPEFTLVHEIGHFLDQQGAGKGKYHASSRDIDYSDFRRIVKESRAIKRLEQMLAEGKASVTLPDGTRKEYPVDKRHVLYLLDMREIWARAYSQYVAVKSGDPLLLKQLDELRNYGGELSYPWQWDEDDFARIADEIDRLMLKFEWRK